MNANTAERSNPDTLALNELIRPLDNFELDVVAGGQAPIGASASASGSKQGCTWGLIAIMAVVLATAGS